MAAKEKRGPPRTSPQKAQKKPQGAKKLKPGDIVKDGDLWTRDPEAAGYFECDRHDFGKTVEKMAETHGQACPLFEVVRP